MVLSPGRFIGLFEIFVKCVFITLDPIQLGRAKEQPKRVMGEQQAPPAILGNTDRGTVRIHPQTPACAASVVHSCVQSLWESRLRWSRWPPPPGRAGLGALRTEGRRGAAVRSDCLRLHRRLAPHLRRCPGSSRRCRRAPRKVVLGSVTPEWRQPGFEGSAACALGGVRPSSRVHLLPAGLCRVSASHRLSHTPGGRRSHEVGAKIKL